MADIGSGAGFPGAIISINRKDLNVILIESVAKKCSFLEYIKAKLSLNYKVICKDANLISEKFDLTTSRALSKPEKAIKLLEKLSKKYVILMLGRNTDLTSIKKLGYNICSSDKEKGFILIKEIKQYD